MKPETIRREVISALGGLLNRDGFVTRLAQWKLDRARPYGLDRICFSFTSCPGAGIGVYPRAHVRHDEVERLLGPLFGVSPRDARETATVGNMLENMMPRGQGGWRIERLDRADRAVADMDRAIRKYAFPYFERFGDLDAVLEACRYDDYRAAVDGINSPNPVARAATAVAIAYLRGDYALAQELIAQKEQALLAMPMRNFPFEPFFRFAEHVRAQIGASRKQQTAH